MIGSPVELRAEVPLNPSRLPTSELRVWTRVTVFVYLC